MTNDIVISNQISLLDSLKIMDQTNRKLLIICEGKKFLGVVSIGDIQRALLDKKDLSFPVSQFTKRKVTYANESDNLDEVKSMMLKEKIETMPVVDRNGDLCDIIEWSQLFPAEKLQENKPINFPVVIMAGGKGTRLLPLTNVLPKPLIPISDKTIIEEIMTQFKSAGCNTFYISVNYMMETIKEYFRRKPEWNIKYVQEEKPLGTGGSLYFLKNKINSTFFVTNCDTLVDINLHDFVSYHVSNKNVVTAVSTVKTIHIPYGTIKTEMGGVIKEIKEKPDLVYQINSGFYILEPSVFNYIRDEQFLNITDLIGRLISNGEKVGAYPVSDGSWTDMGNWNEYLQLIRKKNSI